jgi:CRISPR-associated protein Cas1
LAERGAVLLVCGANHTPAALLWSVDAHHRQAALLDAQLAATRPKGKRLWQQLVQAKVARQADVLSFRGAADAPVRALGPRVRSGDPDNIEAQAARLYWPRLMGPAFRRRRDGPGVNGMLNYGYTVLRAATARAVLAAGLNPALGLHHRAGHNAMRLVDDLMEPFRPFVDLRVVTLAEAGLDSVTPETKRLLAEVMYLDLPSPEGTSPLMVCIQRLANSLARIYDEGQTDMALPGDLPPEGWAGLARLPEAA